MSSCPSSGGESACGTVAHHRTRHLGRRCIRRRGRRRTIQHGTGATTGAGGDRRCSARRTVSTSCENSAARRGSGILPSCTGTPRGHLAVADRRSVLRQMVSRFGVHGPGAAHREQRCHLARRTPADRPHLLGPADQVRHHRRGRIAVVRYRDHRGAQGAVDEGRTPTHPGQQHPHRLTRRGVHSRRDARARLHRDHPRSSGPADGLRRADDGGPHRPRFS